MHKYLLWLNWKTITEPAACAQSQVHTCYFYWEIGFLPLLCNAICDYTFAFLNFVVLPLPQFDFASIQREFAPVFDCWQGEKSRGLETKSRWLVNSKDKIAKLKKMRVKSQLKCKGKNTTFLLYLMICLT